MKKLVILAIALLFILPSTVCAAGTIKYTDDVVFQKSETLGTHIKDAFSFLFLPRVAAAAGSLTCIDYAYPGISKKYETRVVTYTVYFDSAAVAPPNIALDAIPASATGAPRGSLKGWWLLEVDTLYGTTGPTDDSDLYLWRSWGEDKIDVLGGNGVDQIDNATDNTFRPANTTRPLTGAEIFDIDNNAVNSAECTVVFILYR